MLQQDMATSSRTLLPLLVTTSDGSAALSMRVHLITWLL